MGKKEETNDSIYLVAILFLLALLTIMSHTNYKKENCKFDYENRYYEYRKLCVRKKDNSKDCAYSYKRYTIDSVEEKCYNEFLKTCSITIYRACINP